MTYMYGQPPGYLSYSNPYTQLMMQPPRQRQQQGGMGMPSMPMGMMNNIPGLGGGSGGSPFGSLFGGGSAGGGEAALASVDYPLAGGASGGAGGASGVMGSLGPIAAIMAAVAGTKELERAQGNSTMGKIWGSFNAPSFNQIKEDPKLGLTTALGIPFINGLIRNDKAAEAEPEWQGLLPF